MSLMAKPIRPPWFPSSPYHFTLLSTPTTTISARITINTHTRTFFCLCCAPNSNSSSSSSDGDTITTATASTSSSPPLPVVKKRNRYRKMYPGESTGITEEMRFVAMRLRHTNGAAAKSKEGDGEGEADEGVDLSTWQPSMEGFLGYLVDSKVVFNTIERIVDESDNVSYAYFRKTGLERSEGISKDLEGFEKQGLVIPVPQSPSLTYVKYLEELAMKSAPLFLSHFYNIYFAHIAGGQVIAKQVSKKLLEGKELEFYRWEGDPAESLKGVRENLNMLAEHWSRDDKNRCLKETTKSFRYLGQIVRLIIL